MELAFGIANWCSIAMRKRFSVFIGVNEGMREGEGMMDARPEIQTGKGWVR